MSDQNGLVNPWNLKRPDLKQETITITDPSQPNVSLTVTLQELGAPESAAAMSRADDLMVAYRVGGDTDDEDEQVAYPGGDGRPVRLSRRLVTNLCLIEEMQVGEPRYDFNGLLGIAVMMPAGWAILVAKAMAINKKVEEFVGNALRAATGGASGLPSGKGRRTPRSSPTSSAG